MSKHHRDNSLFCGGCWNYLDACDCDIGMLDPDEIPWEYKSDAALPSSTVSNWYFMLPLNYLESKGIPDWMLSQMLAQPSLWTKEMPPDYAYLAEATVIPAEAISVDPWQLNFFTSSIDMKNDSWEEHITNALQALASMANKCAGKSGVGLAACMVSSLFTSYLPEIAGLVDKVTDDIIDWQIPTEIPPYDASWVAKVPGAGPGVPLVTTAAALYFLSNMDPKVVDFLDNQLVTDGPDHFWLTRYYKDQIYPGLGANVSDIFQPAVQNSIDALTDGTYCFRIPFLIQILQILTLPQIHLEKMHQERLVKTHIYPLTHR